jgi:hypothetical protein
MVGWETERYDGVEAHHEVWQYEHRGQDGGQKFPVGDGTGESAEDPQGGDGPLHHDALYPGWFVIRGVAVDHGVVVWDLVLVT